jgi:electron transfer flavoprotein beta subunit
MKAKKKPLDVIAIADLQTDVAPRLATLKVEAPHPRKAGIKVQSVEELVSRLRDEAKVIP